MGTVRRRIGSWTWRIGCVLALGACSGRDANAAPSPDRLVIEVGGEQSSLREALRAAGVAPVEPAPPVPVEPPEAAPPPHVDPEASRNRTVEPTPPPPARPWFEVTLAEGQTPIHLAREHLGDGNRFREILQLNGWDENAARRLRPGTKVRIPGRR